MSDIIMASLGLASFDVTVQPHLCTSRSGKEVTVTEGELNTPLPRVCPECGGRMDRHDRHAVCVQGLPVLGRIHLLRVWVSRCRCRRCGHVESQKAGFVAQGHRITRRLERLIGLELACGHTLKQVAWKYNVHPSVVKDIDRRRLERRFKDRRPHRCRYLAVDEFLLHRGHRYATVFLDLESGDVLWCCEGKDMGAVERFARYVGKRWLDGLEAVAMDMNASYDSAFRALCPHVKVCYDFFHLVKLGNDCMVSRLRRRRQRELLEGGDQAGYRLYKSCRFIVLSRPETIRKRDRQAHEENLLLRGRILAGSIPRNTRLRREDRCLRLERLLEENGALYRCYLLVDQLRGAFTSRDTRDPQLLRERFQAWLRLARHSGVPEALAFADTVERHLEGIIDAIVLGLSTGRLEGTNNMIKTTRRCAYGFRDTQYFFYKIYENSRKPTQNWLSHKILI